ncbi:hypothetical protein BA011_36000 (plasmid) [Rhizobium leguminosarum]|uniref:Uncharacterized protein n=1 Tax=Rhizobium leguminosarum TaxID=384 RepID=A0A1B1CP23_RHILE|nr:hypothetical protein BA011_36000 [Rhizobium leguminosarum]
MPIGLGPRPVAAHYADVPVINWARSQHGPIANIAACLRALLNDEDIAEMSPGLFRKKTVAL